MSFFRHGYKKTWSQSELCDHVEYCNSIDAAAFRFAPEAKSQPSVSGCDLERRSSGMSAL